MGSQVSDVQSPGNGRDQELQEQEAGTDENH